MLFRSQQRPSAGRRPAGADGRRASGRPRRRPAPRPSRTPRRSRTLRRGRQESPFQSEGRIDRIETHVAGRRATLTGRSSITSPTIRDRTVIQGKSGRQDLNLRPLDPQRVPRSRPSIRSFTDDTRHERGLPSVAIVPIPFRSFGPNYGTRPLTWQASPSEIGRAHV